MRIKSLLSALALAALPIVAQAHIIVSIESKSMELTPDQVGYGYVDVFVSTDDAPPPLVAGYQIAVNNSNPSLIQLGTVTVTDPIASTQPLRTHLIHDNFTANYDDTNGPDRVSALAMLNDGEVAILGGEGVMRIPFTVPAGTEGTATLSLDSDPFSGTLFVDSLGAEQQLEFVDGVISITQVPEPHGIAFVLMGMAAMLLTRRRRIA